MRRGATYIAVAGSVVALAAAVALLGAPAPSAPRPAPAPVTSAPATSARPTSATPTAVATPRVAGKRPTDTGCVIVKLSRDLSAKERSQLGLGRATKLRGERTLLVAAPAGMTADEFAARLESSGAVDYAGADHLFQPTYSSNPNDPAFRDQTTGYFPGLVIPHAKSWALRGVGSSHFDEVWPALAFDSAVSDSVRVAVIDSGIYLDHPDARYGNIAGAVDECAALVLGPGGGWSLRTDDDVTPEASSTQPAHGTVVAGEIGQSTNNGYGSAGAAWDTLVDVYKVEGPIVGGESNGRVVMPESAIVNAIDDALEKADDLGDRLVINMSLEMLMEDSSEEPLALGAAVGRARAAGAVIVAAAGNSTLDRVSYPAAFDGVIAVGAATPSAYGLTRASFSNFGSRLDLLAPGQRIWGLAKPGSFDMNEPYPEGGYRWWNGTSMAAPFVSAAAALLLRVEPSLTAAEVESYLTANAADMGPAGRDDAYGWGMLDVSAAYRSLVTPRTTSDARANYDTSATIRFTVTDRDGLEGMRTFYELDYDRGAGGWGTVEGTVMSTADFFEAGSQLGEHTLRYWSVDVNGIREDTRTLTFRLGPDTAPPVTTGNQAGVYWGKATITLSPTDPGEDAWGVASTRYVVDGGAETSGTIATVASSGAHRLDFWSVDRYGNRETTRTAYFEVRPLSAKATIARNVHTVTRNHHIHLTGKLSPFLAGDKVTVQVKYPGASRYTKFYARTVYGSGSWATLTYTPTRRGTYYFRVVFIGDETRLSRLAYRSGSVHVHVR